MVAMRRLRMRSNVTISEDIHFGPLEGLGQSWTIRRSWRFRFDGLAGEDVPLTVLGISVTYDAANEMESLTVAADSGAHGASDLVPLERPTNASGADRAFLRAVASNVTQGGTRSGFMSVVWHNVTDTSETREIVAYSCDTFDAAGPPHVGFDLSNPYARTFGWARTGPSGAARQHVLHLNVRGDADTSPSGDAAQKLWDPAFHSRLSAVEAMPCGRRSWRRVVPLMAHMWQNRGVAQQCRAWRSSARANLRLAQRDVALHGYVSDPYELVAKWAENDRYRPSSCTRHVVSRRFGPRIAI